MPLAEVSNLRFRRIYNSPIKILRSEDVVDGGYEGCGFEREGNKKKMIGCLDRQHKTHIGGTFLGNR